MTEKKFKSGIQLSAKSILIWRIVQAAVLLAGIIIFLCLIFYPVTGLTLLWDILIPVAPLLLVISVGLWRNVCPLATINLLPRRFNFSKKRKMSVLLQSKLGLVSVMVLYVIVPLRHALFNNSGIGSAAMLFIAILIGVTMGFFYDWKSGWCSSLCPIHPVEKLYGSNTLISLPNAHCDLCVNCSVPCPDSTPNFHPQLVEKNIYQKISGLLMVGGFPGFVWGWFHVPDQSGIATLKRLLITYPTPFFCAIVTLLLYMILVKFFKTKNQRIIINIYAAAAVSCYYWYRIPNLFGFGIFDNDGLLINLKNTLPAWSITMTTVAFTAFFFYWFVIRKTNKKSWFIRPSF